MAECTRFETTPRPAEMNRCLSIVRPLLLLGLTGAALLSSRSATTEPVLYVGPREGGVWFASTPTPAPNQRGLRTGTLADALSVARALKADPASAGRVTVQLRGGRYELPAPIELTDADSGLTLCAYRDERPILSGARQLTRWSPLPDRPLVWQSALPSPEGTFRGVRSLFTRDRRLPRARTPNSGFFRFDGASPDGTPPRFRFRGSDLQPGWVADPRAEVVALIGWTSFRLPLLHVDPTNRIATLGGAVRTANRENDARYFLENTPDALDTPGEWRIDVAAGKIIYLAPPGERIDEADLRAGQLETLLVVRGDQIGRAHV